MDCDKLMSAAYHHMGEFDRFEKAMRRFENSYPDTINPNVLICLEQRSEASKLQGRTADALDYLQRAYVIRDSLDRRNQRDQLAELATVYHLQEEQLARKEKEAEAERSHIINIALVIGLIAAIAFAAWFFYKRRETARKNRVLAREIADAIKYKEKWEEHEKSVAELGGQVHDSGQNQVTCPSDSDTGLFLHLRDVILREKLYLNPQLDRQMLVDRLGLSKERIGAAFSKGSPYKSLIDFLTDCRLPHAAKLLTERPDLSIADVARESGFPTADTFSRNFRQKYTLTPTQFREQQATSE
jgi:AraC-like DNA-binding protein